MALQSTEQVQPVIVNDVDIKFFSLVRLLVKLAFASIPALLIVTIIVSAIFMMVAGVFQGLVPH